MLKPFKAGSLAAPGLSPGSCCGTCAHAINTGMLICCNDDHSYKAGSRQQPTGWWYRHTVPAWGWCPSFEFNGAEIVRTGSRTKEKEA